MDSRLDLLKEFAILFHTRHLVNNSVPVLGAYVPTFYNRGENILLANKEADDEPE